MDNIYGQYKNVRNAVWQLLLDYKIDRLPVSTSYICKTANIRLLCDTDANELKTGEYGVAICQNGQWYIIYDDTDTPQRIRFTIAHELGHIFLGHAMLHGYHTRRTNIVKPADETSADMFAARLLAPSCVLWGIGAQTAAEIAAVCNISITAARIRAERLDLLRQRNAFLIAPLERDVYKQFDDFIKNNRLH